MTHYTLNGPCFGGLVSEAELGEQTLAIVNADEIRCGSYRHTYLVLMGAFGHRFLVNASSEEDALDEVIDYCEEPENRCSGFLIPMEEESDYMDENFCIPDCICGGNYGRWLDLDASTHLQIFRLDY